MVFSLVSFSFRKMVLNISKAILYITAIRLIYIFSTLLEEYCLGLDVNYLFQETKITYGKKWISIIIILQNLVLTARKFTTEC